MVNKILSVDDYLAQGCGRCPYGGTPQCKVHSWPKELAKLRQIVLDCDLTEEVKWGVPCYTYEKRNVLIVAAFKEYCSLNLFKGALLPDPDGILVSAGENSQSARQIRFTDLKDIRRMEPALKRYILAAVELEKSGAKVKFKKIDEHPVPAELRDRLASDARLRDAFEALTPGRRRSFLLHIGQPKQEKTRLARLEKCIPLIMDGIGLNDRYDC